MSGAGANVSLEVVCVESFARARVRVRVLIYVTREFCYLMFKVLAYLGKATMIHRRDFRHCLTWKIRCVIKCRAGVRNILENRAGKWNSSR